VGFVPPEEPVAPVYLDQQQKCGQGDRPAEQEQPAVIMVQAVDGHADHRAGNHRTDRNDDSGRRGELGEQNLGQQSRSERSRQGEVAPRDDSVQDENRPKPSGIGQKSPPRRHQDKVGRQPDQSAAQRIEAVGKHAEEIAGDKRKQISDHQKKPVSVHSDPQFLRVLDRKEVDRSEREHRRRLGKHIPAVIGQRKTLPEVDDDGTHHPQKNRLRVLPGIACRFLLNRRRIDAFLHPPAKREQPDAIQRTDSEKDDRGVRLDLVDQPGVEDHPRAEADHPEQRKKSPQQLMRNHIVGQRTEQG